MEKTVISALQPLFCERAALLKAQTALLNNTTDDCQLRLRFADGQEIPLPLKRELIERIVNSLVDSVEDVISETLEEPDTNTESA